MSVLLAMAATFCLGTVLVVAVALGLLVLVKLGVITHYALKQEPADEGSYELDQSREAGEK